MFAALVLFFSIPAKTQDQDLSDPFFRAGVGLGTAYLCPTNDDAKMMEAAQIWLDEAGHTENSADDLWALVAEGASQSDNDDPLVGQMAEGMACTMVERIEALYID